MSAPKSYDLAVSAVFTMTSGTFTREYNNRADLELALKQAKDLGFVVKTASGTSTYYPLANVVSIAVTDIV